MNERVRGVIVFVAVLMTIGIWAPLRNHPTRLPNGAVLTETYFGVLNYLTLRTETKEPEYSFHWRPNYKNLAGTIFITTALWVTVLTILRQKRKSQSQPQLPDSGDPESH